MTAALVRAFRWLPLVLVLGLLAFAISSPRVNMLLWAVADKGPTQAGAGRNAAVRVSHRHLAACGTRDHRERDLRLPGGARRVHRHLVPDVTTLPLLLFRASMEGNYQIASITALILLVPSVEFVLLIERFLRADVLAKVGS